LSMLSALPATVAAEARMVTPLLSHQKSTFPGSPSVLAVSELT
jgi:hypothetical protein